MSLPAGKAQALLAYLALPPGRPHPRDKLASLLWGNLGEVEARSSLRQALFVLRRSLSMPRLVVTQRDNVSLDSAAVDVDVLRFDRCVAEGTPGALEKAAALYEGDLLAGLAVSEPGFEQWLLQERERLRELAMDALAKLLLHQRSNGASEAAIQTGLRLLALDPTQESVHRTLMRLYAELGKGGAALRQYQQCVGIVQRELGVEPETETKLLYQQILRDRIGWGPPSTPVESDATPLFGREREMSRLRQALASASEGTGRVALVFGEAGIGKTRLIEWLCTEAAGARSRVLAGRAYETAQILPFSLWADALRKSDALSSLNTVRGVDPAWREQIGRVLQELGFQRPERLPLAEQHVRLFEAVSQLLAHMSALGPMVLVLEDLHWADDMSLRLLSFACRRLASHPVLIVGSLRQEELADAPILRRVVEELDRKPGFAEIALEPLSRADTENLVAVLSRTGTMASRVVELAKEVWDLSRGNPFVIVEIMRASELGQMSQATARLALPERVRGMVARRLDRLDDRGRRLVAVAAVIGRRCDVPLLAASSGLAEYEAADGVEELVRRRILHEVEGGLEFAHDHIQQVAYQSLIASRRAVLHADVAFALEKLHHERLSDVYDVLAYHFARTDHAAKAVQYLTHLAREAFERYGLAEAVGFLNEALEHAHRLPSPARESAVVDLVTRLCPCLFFLARLPESLELLRRHQSAPERLGNPSASARYYFWLGHTYAALGDPARATEWAGQALAEADRAGDDFTRARAYFVLTLAGYWSGRHAEAVANGQRAIALLEPGAANRNFLAWLGATCWALGASYALVGDAEAALRYLSRAESLGDAVGYGRLHTLAAIATADLLAKRGEWDVAIEHCGKLLQRVAGTSDAPLAAGFLGSAYLEKGDSEAAIAWMEPALEILRRAPILEFEAVMAARLAEAHRLAGHTERAREFADEACRLTAAIRCAYAIGEAQRVAGRVAQAEGDLARANDHLSDALHSFASAGIRLEVARTRLDLAQLSRGTDTARYHLAQARDLFDALGLRKDAMRVEQLSARSS